ncbi:carbonic anhydrase [Geotalea sp. SG265]|uniref:carbonic anhydrase n=1 Tax=Geotalea sp. SG265 TaxID=2922867 RepID=UPI001FAF8CB1|nr:carbonic anhydrase [Geotalea sp. SG265]
MGNGIIRGLTVASSILFIGLQVHAGSETDVRVQEFKAGLGGQPTTEHSKVEPAAQDSTRSSQGKGSHDGIPKKKKASSSHHTADARKHGAVSAHHVEAVEPEEGIKRLLEGNKRFVEARVTGPNRKPARRAAIAQGQNPFAIIIGCSDSRVPPELLFDQGFGDLFVIRTAGNIVDSIALGSIEYAVDHLGAKLIVVLGHERCGAVDATIKGGDAPSHIKTLVDTIKPAVDKARTTASSGGHGCDFQCKSVKSNVKMVAEKIRSASPIVAEAVEDGNVRIIGAYYDLDSGETTLTYKPYL